MIPTSDNARRFAFHVLWRTLLFFILFNLLFAWAQPMEKIGTISLYNGPFPGRQRLPYGEQPASDYNVSLHTVSAMVASHEAANQSDDDAFRVVLLGDSATWGWFLENDETLTGQLNAANLVSNDGRPMRFYNFGYPIMSLSKDLLLLEEALAFEPDLVIWLVTLQSFPRDKQLFPPLLQNNPERVDALIEQYGLDLDPNDPRLVERSFYDETIIGRRRSLADYFRLQLLAIPWTATGVDQAIPNEIPLRQSDFEADESWQSFEAPATLTSNELAFDVLAAGVDAARQADVPMLIVNEPMFVSTGRNSDLRYNAFYPRWAYDQYRGLLADEATVQQWQYVDLWDTIAAQFFSDSPVHLTPDGNRQLAELLAPLLVR